MRWAIASGNPTPAILPDVPEMDADTAGVGGWIAIAIYPEMGVNVQCSNVGPARVR